MSTSMSILSHAFTSPSITLYWRGYFRTLWGAYFPDGIEDRALLRQFLDEAGLRGQGHHVKLEQMVAVLAVASKHGYRIETIGDEADVLVTQGEPVWTNPVA